MEKVVNKLSEIEAAAVAIMDNANTMKKEISDNMESKVNEFDKKVDAETAQKLSELIVKLQTETAQELNKLKVCTQQTLVALDDEYNKNHSTLAQKILSAMIRE
jgi:hypothetical protein